jgi:hypothetical protein
MQPPASLLEGLSASCAVELGVPPGDEPWTSHLSSLAKAVVVGPDGEDAADDEIAALDGPVDLVIDHPGTDPHLARAHFARWFAALAPGGAYVIDGLADHRFVLEVALATILHEVVDRMCTDGSVVVVWRTAEPFEADRFVLTESYTDPFGLVR